MNASALPLPTPTQRWLALSLVSLAMFGNYYIYDSLGPVVELLQAQLGFSYQQIGMLSSAYSVAALLVLLAGGMVLALPMALLSYPAALRGFLRIERKRYEKHLLHTKGKESAP